MTLLDDLDDVGRDPRSGGYRRHVWTDADAELRMWFAQEAARRGLDLVEDANGNQLAWWGSGPGAVLVGSHLDSVPDGGRFDGPLGVTSALEAVDRLRSAGHVPDRPLIVANFAEEEGSRFGIACLGSRLATGALEPDRARALLDRDGTSLADAMRAHGRDPRLLGRQSWIDDVSAFVELHVEQGRALADLDAPVGVGSAIWPHGRWQLDMTGCADHAGTTRMEDRRDPMITFAESVLAAHREAGPSRATFGRVDVAPNGTNAIPSRVRAWLDVRAETQEEVDVLVRAIVDAARRSGTAQGVDVAVDEESRSDAVVFDLPLRERLAELVHAPVLATAAGHDAGILSAHLPTAMLFVRNETGVSHSPDEHADTVDCEAGVEALARVLQDLT
ncbi:allantoate amidohydrolase [Aeromicrobium choanae]|uniref:N-carbamoyl-L-amino-acid hydrolase n=1 Tax=Aeromicrobium choanae TaxID=1736691 RepID=A0A1T4Z4C5_9ACTN|nr:allantoate amidohydrolase [Aeromicrobium choanae]SKB08421.1 N-carbamoyl-L-amino-acid hydrolase [Aeromicrobium choanae]